MLTGMRGVDGQQPGNHESGADRASCFRRMTGNGILCSGQINRCIPFSLPAVLHMIGNHRPLQSLGPISQLLCRPVH